jgi:hypothetical protein
MVGEIGLTDIQADNTGKITVQGEVLNENAAITTADALKSLPLFATANVISIEKMDAEGSRPGFRFRIAGTGKFGRPPKPPGQ